MALAKVYRIYTPVIKINGKEEDTLYDNLLEVSVDLALFLPGMFTISIQDQKMEYGKLFKPGAEISLAISEYVSDPELGDSGKEPLFEGVVTELEFSFAADGLIILQVRGYDYSIKLTQGKTIRSFQKQSDSQMITKVIQDAGLSAQVDSSSEKYDSFIQFNQTNWNFLLSRARRLGYIIYTEKKTVSVKKPVMGSAVSTLTLAHNLISFEPRVSVLGQLSETTFTGWDSREKKAISAKAGAANNKFHSQTLGSKEIGKALGKVTDYLLDQTLPISAGAAKTTAQAQIDLAESQYFQAEGLCEGDPNLKPAAIVEIKRSGLIDISPYGGKFMLTHVRHRFSQGNFTTWFKISGASIESLPFLLNPGDTTNQPRIDGVVTAIVSNNNDSQEKLGRVKVKYPWMPVIDAQIESDWVRIAWPGAGFERGLYFIPEVDDEVLVAFDHGDINQPYIIGGLHQRKDKPPIPTDEAVAGGKVNQRMIKTRSGHTIVFSDENGKESITIRDKTQKNQIVIDSANNSMMLKAEGDITLDAGGKLTMKSKSDLTVETMAAGKINTTGALNVESKQAATIKGTTGATVQGLKVDIKGDTNTSVQGGVMVEVKGAMVKIN